MTVLRHGLNGFGGAGMHSHENHQPGEAVYSEATAGRDRAMARCPRSNLLYSIACPRTHVQHSYCAVRISHAMSSCIRTASRAGVAVRNGDADHGAGLRIQIQFRFSRRSVLYIRFAQLNPSSRRFGGRTPL
jgi:hypothetical protein